MKSEKDVKKEVKKLLDSYGWFWWMPPANGYGKSGISDFNALKNGVFLAIETKFGGNSATPLQKGYLETVASQSGQAFVVDESMIPWLAQWLAMFDANTDAVRAAEPGTDPRKAIPEDHGAALVNATLVLTEGWRV